MSSESTLYPGHSRASQISCLATIPNQDLFLSASVSTWNHVNSFDLLILNVHRSDAAAVCQRFRHSHQDMGHEFSSLRLERQREKRACCIQTVCRSCQLDNFCWAQLGKG